MERIKSKYYVFHEVIKKIPLLDLFYLWESFFNPDCIKRIENELYEFHGWG
jgi:hypothetical protein